VIHKFSILIIFISSSLVYAQTVKGPLKSNEAYLTEISRSINDSSYQSSQIIRKNWKGEGFSIPHDWRLVSVVNLSPKNNTSNEFVLFFQDSNSAIHSLGVQSDGSLSGNNLIHIPATKK
jgi:hypothetical protein